MKRQLSLLSSSILIIGILYSCKKDKVPEPGNPDSGTTPPVEECTDIVFSGGEIFDNWINTGTQYSVPVFSPFSDDEFVYVKWESGSERQLIKRNITTGTETILCTTGDVNGYYIGGQADWGSSHWIVFNVGTGGSGVGYIIKDDGTSLTQLLSSNVNFISPKFNGTGSQILAWGTGIENTTFPSLPIYDLSGNVADTFIFGNNQSFYWGAHGMFSGEFEDGLFAFSNHNVSPIQQGFCYKTSDTTIQQITSIDGFGDFQLFGVGKFQNKIYYIVPNHGLYEFDEVTQTTSLIQEICDTRKLMSMSVSPNTGNILIEEVKRTKVDEFGGVDEQHNIYLLNPNTKEKTAILVE